MEVAVRRGLNGATRALAVLARSAAFAICVSPLLLVLMRTVVGLDAVRPWRDWACALPLSVTVDICPPLFSPASRSEDALARDLFLSGGLALLAAVAYLKPLVWLVWLLAVFTGALPLTALVVIGIVVVGLRPNDPDDPIPGGEFFHPTLLFVLVAAPLTMHAGRWAERRSEANAGRSP